MSDLLHRQVPQALIQAGLVSSQAFSPQKREDYGLSVSQGHMVTARRSFELHTHAGFKSAGVWSVTEVECAELKLPVIPEPTTEPYVNEAHAIIQFSKTSRPERKQCAQELARRANARGVQYSAESD